MRRRYKKLREEASKVRLAALGAEKLARLQANQADAESTHQYPFENYKKYVDVKPITTPGGLGRLGASLGGLNSDLLNALQD